MTKKALRKILIVGVLILVGALLTSCLPKKEEIQPESDGLTQVPVEEETNSTGLLRVGWKTYKSEKFGFEVKYPPDWNFSENDFQDFMTLSWEKKDGEQKFEEEPLPGMSEATYWISLSARDNPKGLSAKENYLQSFSGKARVEAEKKIELVSVAGREGIKYSEGAAPASGPSTIVVVTHKNKSYQFSYGALATKETHEKFRDVFEGIISSFKFVVK